MARVTNEVDFLKESLKTKTEVLAEVSKKVLGVKQELWQAEAQKQYLQSKCQGINTSFDSESCLADLKDKYESFKGTSLEKVLFGLIKAYQTYKNHTVSLSVLVREKEELLSKYRKITSSLSQESNLTSKLKSLHEFLIEKEKSTNYLKEKLIKTRNDHNSLRDSLESGPIKKCFEEVEKIKKSIEETQEGQKYLLIELGNISQSIETEKAIGTVKVDDVRKMIKQKIQQTEKQVTDLIKRIKEKERNINRVKICVSKFDCRKSFVTSPDRSVKTGSSYTPKCRSLVLSPDFKGSQRNDRNLVIGYLRNGIDYKNTRKIEKVIDKIGNESQSFASKIIMLNRGSYF